MNGTHHRLDAAAMLERAQTETGASDWGDATLPERGSPVTNIGRSITSSAMG